MAATGEGLFEREAESILCVAASAQALSPEDRARRLVPGCRVAAWFHDAYFLGHIEAVAAGAGAAAGAAAEEEEERSVDVVAMFPPRCLVRSDSR